MRAFRYILKPLEFNDIKDKLNTCISYIKKKVEKLLISTNYEKVLINTSDILFIEVNDKKLNIYTKKRNYTIFKSLKTIEKDINSDQFFRCHKVLQVC